MSRPINSTTSHRRRAAMRCSSSEFATEAYLPECHVIFRRFLLAAVLFSACFFVYSALDSLHFLYRTSIFPLVYDHGSSSALGSSKFQLDKVLKDAAMEDGTVILTTLNEAWAHPNSIFDLFLESFRIGDQTLGLLNHLVIIALDEKAFNRCLVLHRHCFALVSYGINFSGEAHFMSSDYQEMMWRRIEFLRTVLEKGYNFVFSDADVMWFRNPFPHFHSDADFQIACDHFTGNPEDVRNQPNGGFNFVKANSRSIEFYKFWHSSRLAHPGRHDQDVLNIIKFDPFLSEIGLKMRFLDTTYFGGFCENSKNLSNVCTMHANCCIGLESKLHDLRIMLADWNRYITLPTDWRRSSELSWRVPQNCSIAGIERYYSPAPTST